MAEGIKLSYSLTRKDLQLGHFSVIWNRILGKLYVCLGFVMLVFGIYVMDSKVPSTWVIAILGFLLTAFPVWYSHVSAAYVWFRSPGLSEPAYVEIDDRGLYVKGFLGESKVTGILGLDVSKSTLLIRMGPNMFLFIPRRVFASDDEFEVAANYLKPLVK